MLIDSHCHLDYLNSPEVDGGIEGAVARAQAAGVDAVVVPAVSPENFERVRQLAARHSAVFYALGIHPMYVEGLADTALATLENALDRSRHDPKLVAVGEIGLDHYVPGLNREKMNRFFLAQCALARRFDLPVILHVRKAQDQVAKGLRQFGIRRGIAHAFNGSDVQANAFIAQGICLGFGGAMTFTRANQIRRLAQSLPLSSIVLETDSPDIAPAWRARGQANEPAETRPIAEHLAALRGLTADEVIRATGDNVCRVLPGLACSRPSSH
jgi:TatD DNase family protein